MQVLKRNKDIFLKLLNTKNGEQKQSKRQADY